MSLNEKKGVTSVELNSPRNKELERRAGRRRDSRISSDASWDGRLGCSDRTRQTIPGSARPRDVATEEEGAAETEAPPHAYHLDMELELRNVSDSPQRLAYSLSGPTGLPLEGWWYSAKIHPRMFYGAGTMSLSRPITSGVWWAVPNCTRAGGKDPDERAIPLFAEDEPVANRTVRFTWPSTRSTS